MEIEGKKKARRGGKRKGREGLRGKKGGEKENQP